MMLKKKLKQSKKQCNWCGERIPITKKQIIFANARLPDKFKYKMEPYSNFRFDWGLIGGDLAKLYFEPYSTIVSVASKEDKITKELYNIEAPANIVKREIEKWLNWMSLVAFPFNRMIQTNNFSNKILLRIAVSKLNKIQLDKNAAAFIFDNLISSNMKRREVAREYVDLIIYELPF